MPGVDVHNPLYVGVNTGETVTVTNTGNQSVYYQAASVGGTISSTINDGTLTAAAVLAAGYPLYLLGAGPGAEVDITVTSPGGWSSPPASVVSDSRLAGGFLGSGSTPVVRATDISKLGIKADARNASGLTTNGTTALTVGDGSATAVDVGRTVVVYSTTGAGVVGQAVISAYVSSTSLTMATTIASATSALGVIGTDDTTAWQAAITAAYAGTGPQLITSDKTCKSLVAGAQQTGTVANTNGHGVVSYTYSGQLLLPANPWTSPIQLCEIDCPLPFADVQEGVAGDVEGSSNGLVIISSATSGNVVDIIPDPNGFTDGVGAYSHIGFRSGEGVVWRTAFNKNGGGPGGLNLLAAGIAKVHGLIDVDWPSSSAFPAIPPSPGPTSNAGCALVLPGFYNQFVCEWSGSVFGYPKGVSFSEWAKLTGIVDSCGSGFAPGGLASLNRTLGLHANELAVGAQDCNLGIEPVGPCRIVGSMDFELLHVASVDDPSSYLSGELILNPGISGNTPYYGPAGFVGRVPTTLTGAYLKLRTTYVAVAPGPSSPVIDSLIRSSPAYSSTTAFGMADGSNHPWIATGGTFIPTTVGARATPNANQCLMGVLQGPSWPSQHLSATIKTSAATNRTNVGFFFRAVDGTTLLGVSLVIVSGENQAQIFKTVSNTFTTLATGLVSGLAANTSYPVDVYVQSSPQPNSLVLVTLFVNGALACSYTLTASEAATFVANTNMGLYAFASSTNDDGGSVISNFAVNQVADLGASTEVGYDQITSTVSVTSITEASGTTIISCAAHTFDGAPVIAEFFTPGAYVGTTAGQALVACLFEGATEITRLNASYNQAASTGLITPWLCRYRFTPTAGSHTYTVTAFVAANSGGPGIDAGAGGTGNLSPAYMRFTKV